MTLAKFIATSGIALVATCGIAAAQNLPQGRLYAFHSGPQHSCPGLDCRGLIGISLPTATTSTG
jgi:hypothetical protein